jgi:hypothetical protein
VSFDVTRLVVGMEVISPAGESIGRVKEVRVNDFLVDMPLRRDVYVPFSAVREVGGQTVILDLTRDAIGEQGWEKGPLLGGPLESDSTAERSDIVVGTGDPAERGTWSASSDAYDLGPLDTRAGRQATSGADDGEVPPAGDVTPNARSRSTKVSEDDRLRDMSG